MATRGRRRLGSPDTRGAVLHAARELFAELGFERTTMRAVAARAGVDPALIYHYFGGKDGLLSAALQPPVDPVATFAGIGEDAERAGEEFIRRVVRLWEDHPEVREQMLAMLRTGLSHDQASRLLRDVLSSLILAAIGDVLAGDRRELRAALIGSHVGGLMLARYVLKVPGAAAASPEDLARAVGPVIQHYLTGTIAADRLSAHPGRTRLPARRQRPAWPAQPAATWPGRPLKHDFSGAGPGPGRAGRRGGRAPSRRRRGGPSGRRRGARLRLPPPAAGPAGR